MIEVTMKLLDANEMNGFTRFVEQVEGYRVGNTRLAQAQEAAAPAPTEADVAPEPTPVVAAITPEGAVKPPKESELHEVTQAYMNKHGLDKALEVVREIAGAVTRLSEVKDPAKLAEIYKRFSEGVK